MNRTKRECLMQRLPAPADILALIPAQEDATRTAVICAHGRSLMLGATPEHVLACLAEREDKALRLIRRNAARLMARRRYINTAYAALVLQRRGTGSDIALQNGDIIHSLWAFGTLERHMREGRALHFKLLNDVRRQLRFAEDLA